MLKAKSLEWEFNRKGRKKNAKKIQNENHFLFAIALFFAPSALKKNNQIEGSCILRTYLFAFAFYFSLLTFNFYKKTTQIFKSVLLFLGIETHHPLNTELVIHHSEVSSPECILHRQNHFSSFG
jgi:hypothetical protein